MDLIEEGVERWHGYPSGVSYSAPLFAFFSIGFTESLLASVSASNPISSLNKGFLSYSSLEDGSFDTEEQWP